MAVIKCPECGGNVSDAAAACPHCGYAVAAHVQREKEAIRQHELRVQQAQASARQAEAAKAKAKTNRVIGGIGVALLMSMCCVSSLCNAQDEHKAQEQADAKAAHQELKKNQRIADTKKNKETHQATLLKQVEEAKFGEAKRTLGLLKEAFPKEDWSGVETDIANGENLTSAMAELETARKLLKSNDVIKADDTFARVEQKLGQIRPTGEAQTKDVESIKAKVAKERKSIAKKVQKARADSAKAAKAAEEQRRKCGDNTKCIEVTAQKLHRDYEANEVRAAQKYKDATLVITGRIERIEESAILAVPRVTLKAGYLGISIDLQKTEAAQVAQFRKGQKIQVRCDRVGTVIMGSPTVDKCRLLSWWE